MWSHLEWSHTFGRFPSAVCHTGVAFFGELGVILTLLKDLKLSLAVFTREYLSFHCCDEMAHIEKMNPIARVRITLLKRPSFGSRFFSMRVLYKLPKKRVASRMSSSVASQMLPT